MPRTPDITVAAVTAYGRPFPLRRRAHQSAPRASISPPATSSAASRCSRPSCARCAKRPPGASSRRPCSGSTCGAARRARRATLRFAFTGTVSDHDATPAARPRHRAHPLAVAERARGARATGCAVRWSCAAWRTTSPATRGSLASVAQLDLESAAARRPPPRACEARSARPARCARIRTRGRSCKLPVPVPRRARHRRPLRRRGLRGRGAAAEGGRLGRAGALHEQLGGGRRCLLHRRPGLPGCPRRGRRACASRCTG